VEDKMLKDDLITTVNRLSVEDKTVLMLFLMKEIGNSTCPMLEVTGLSHGKSLVRPDLPDDLCVFPLSEVNWNLIALDLDKT